MIIDDLPILHKMEDKLDRSLFAESLAETIVRHKSSTSFAIGLSGGWGSGKTSLLNMVLESVEEIDKTVVILNFNPWLCSDPNQLIHQFFRQMAAAFKSKKPSSDQIWTLIDQYADVFDLMNLIPGIGSILGSTVSKIFSKIAKGHAGNKDLLARKKQIVEKLKIEKLKIVVAIDDVDRLSEDEIIAVFQLVKVLADFPNTVYVLVFDYDVVVHALRKVQYGDGKAYLEKIIQVPFEIPTPDIESIHSIFLSRLLTILGDLSIGRWDKTTWAELFQFGFKNYIRSIRDVIRFTNVFSLKYDLLKDETDPVDLLGLTCLQVFEPFVYSKLPEYKEILCGTNYIFAFDQKEAEETVKRVITAIVSKNREITSAEATKKILGILFPKMQTETGLSHIMGRAYEPKEFLIKNNIAVSICFDRYFALSLEKEAIPTTVIRKMIYEVDEIEFTREMRRIYGEGKIKRLFETINAYAKTKGSLFISATRALLIIKCLTRYWNSFKVEDDGFLSMPFSWCLLNCVDSLLELIDSNCRFECIYSVFKDKEVPPSTLSLLLHNYEIQHGRFTEKPAKENPDFSLEEVLQLEEIFKVCSFESLDSGNVFKQHNGLNFLWMLERLDSEFASNKKKDIIKDNYSLIKVIGYCTSHGTTASRSVSKIWTINPNAIKEFVDIDEAERRVDAFTKTKEFFSLSRADQMDALAFLIFMKQDVSESIVENNISEDDILKELNKLGCKNSEIALG